MECKVRDTTFCWEISSMRAEIHTVFLTAELPTPNEWEFVPRRKTALGWAGEEWMGAGKMWAIITLERKQKFWGETRHPLSGCQSNLCWYATKRKNAEHSKAATEKSYLGLMVLLLNFLRHWYLNSVLITEKWPRPHGNLCLKEKEKGKHFVTDITHWGHLFFSKRSVFN